MFYAPNGCINRKMARPQTGETMNMKMGKLSESSLIELVARIAPYGASFIPASYTFKNAQVHLDMGKAESFVAAAVVEMLGLATIHTTLKIIDKARGQKEAKRKSSYIDARLTGAMAIVYLVIVITVNVLLDLDQPVPVVISKALLSLITVPAAVTLSIFNLHKMQESASDTQSMLASLRGKLGALAKKVDKFQAEATQWKLLADKRKADVIQWQRNAEGANKLATSLQRDVNQMKKDAEQWQPVAEAWQSMNERSQLAAMANAGIVTKEDVMAKISRGRRTVEDDMKRMNGVVK